MKITKQQLKQIIKEELEVILTNEEVAEMFGDEVVEQLEDGAPEVPAKDDYSRGYNDGKDDKPKAQGESEEYMNGHLAGEEAMMTDSSEEALRLPNPWDEPGGPIAFTNRVADRFRKKREKE